MEFQNICNEMVVPFLLRHPVHNLTTQSEFKKIKAYADR